MYPGQGNDWSTTNLLYLANNPGVFFIERKRNNVYSSQESSTSPRHLFLPLGIREPAFGYTWRRSSRLSGGGGKSGRSSEEVGIRPEEGVGSFEGDAIEEGKRKLERSLRQAVTHKVTRIDKESMTSNVLGRCASGGFALMVPKWLVFEIRYPAAVSDRHPDTTSAKYPASTPSQVPRCKNS
ncbi:hypothetical protein QYF36_022021 [Acer negundo]|nr:hypothetical protein QYF36_022021 [Acer negundo]